MSDNSQKFIGRNRPPRVQIEYDVELYGARRSIELPFVMGVMADLSGQPEQPLPPVAERQFLDIDIDNFDQRLRAIAPRVAFTVPNELTGQGHLGVDLRFTCLDDFSPEAIARQIPALRTLLEARTRLKDLLTYMDGKADAEALLAQVLADPALQAALALPEDEAEDASGAPDHPAALPPPGSAGP